MIQTSTLRRVISPLAVVLVTGFLGGVVGAGATDVPERAPAAGSSGIGDPYFPADGNGGIDVQSYAVHDRYAFASKRLRGTTRISLRATQDLSSFNLDFLLGVDKVTVNGVKAGHTKPTDHELRITPATPLVSGATAVVTVKYAGRPARHRYEGEGNWLADGREVVAMNEPHMAPWWFPSNDHPRDKALMDVRITVPKGREVIANGKLVNKKAGKHNTTWHWRADEPMATYLAFFAAGDFKIDKGTHQGRPWLVAASKALPRRTLKTSMRQLRRSPAIVKTLESDLGAYPFSVTGGLVTSLDPGFALENQTRPTYPALSGNATSLLVHELAHQWFGDDVAVDQWRDIWLNEGAASFMEVRYDETHGGPSGTAWLQREYNSVSASDGLWKTPVVDPGKDDIFAYAVYYRGSMAMQALRNRIGEDAFWTLLRTWLSTRSGGNGSSVQFEALAGQISGQNLTSFFQAWLRDTAKPARTADNGL
ncbi:M1 family metallopeptidase [Nocardioides sp. InS609-2]|uniref:M1 family metallopeptidase n=1 Tax=Nocardioides sp. InS609-2 TaxID=2760705 RepID=UPI0020C0FBBF|nr:M1 family metallopeptidase [Nocardioides sp. InS609-2]